MTKYGVGVPAHSQNTLAQFDIATSYLVGFAVRDHTSVRAHLPTLRTRALDLPTVAAMKMSHINAASLESVWDDFFQNVLCSHLGDLMHGLHIQPNDGWAIIRSELVKWFDHNAGAEAGANSHDCRQFLLCREKINRKAFLRMKLANTKRSVIEFFFYPPHLWFCVPNMLTVVQGLIFETVNPLL